ncbi:MAG: DUF2231 domain-containing protein [Dysgonamonadaceae bacterium]
MLVHFPIALVATGFLLELVFLFVKKEVCLTRAGFYLLILGTLAAIVTWLSGFFFTSEMEGAAGQVRDTHELFATITMVLLIIASVFRIMALKKSNSKQLKKIAFVMYGLAMLSVSVTGFYGGILVFNYMMPL